MPDPADLTAFGAAVSCCERRWVEALQVLHDMQHGGELLVDYVDWGGLVLPMNFLGFNAVCGVNSPAGQRDVEYKHLDATVPNIPECFFQILHIHCCWQDFSQTLLFAVLPLLLAKKAEGLL